MLSIAQGAYIKDVEVNQTGVIPVLNPVIGILNSGSILEARPIDVALVLLGGQPLFGEADLLAGLGETCEAVDVCSQSRAICAEQEFGGARYADLLAAIGAGYPAFFCGDPLDEPTCLPTRPGEYTGQPTPIDGDGDGIDDVVDNCSTVFNPVRPEIDGGVQPDSDGDGIGDACDPTPLRDDIDGDTVPNETDNCPWDANPQQEDDDSDGKGNACDACPNVANPGTGCPPPRA